MAPIEWRPAVGYEDRYEVSNTGVIRNRRTGRALSPFAGKAGHLRVGMWDGAVQKNRSVHRVVAFTFHGAPDEGQEVRHLDGDPTNNRATNLKWGTKSENMLDAVRHGTHRQTRKTHCPRGHEFTPENLRNIVGHRTCRICHNRVSSIRQSEMWRRKREGRNF